MKPAQVFRLRPGQRIRWTATIWDSPQEGEVLEITPQCNFLIDWDDNSRSVLTPERLAFGTFEPLGEDQGWTTLQEDIADRLERADIPPEHIGDILELIADGEQVRENAADARAIDEALEDYRVERKPLNEAEADEYADAYLRWTNT